MTSDVIEHCRLIPSTVVVVLEGLNLNKFPHPLLKPEKLRNVRRGIHNLNVFISAIEGVLGEHDEAEYPAALDSKNSKPSHQRVRDPLLIYCHYTIRMWCLFNVIIQ